MVHTHMAQPSALLQPLTWPHENRLRFVSRIVIEHDTLPQIRLVGTAVTALSTTGFFVVLTLHRVS